MRWNLKKSYEKAAKKKPPNGTLMGFLSRAIEQQKSPVECVKEE